MGQVFHHEFTLDNISDETVALIKTDIKQDLPVNHRQMLTRAAKRILEKHDSIPDFYAMDVDESSDLLFMSDGAAYYAAEYLLKNNFKVDDEYKHIVDQFYTNEEKNQGMIDQHKDLVSKYQHILHIGDQKANVSVFGGNGGLKRPPPPSRGSRIQNDETINVLDLANKIKHSISVENYKKLLSAFIVSTANKNEEDD
jgi:hypothetical protein